MTDDQAYVDVGGQKRADRRVYHKVRDVFTRACTLIAPLLLDQKNEDKSSGYYISQVLRNHFPELSSTEVHVLVTAAVRVQQEMRLKPSGFAGDAAGQAT